MEMDKPKQLGVASLWHSGLEVSAGHLDGVKGDGLGNFVLERQGVLWVVRVQRRLVLSQ